MAAYNGARFIEAQVQSILPQLAASDEIVIVDDCSHDDTVARIQNIGDGRIRLFSHERNEGIVATFEEALRYATGQILFLSDDDDLWAPGKVEQVVKEFEAHPEVQIVTTRAALIDDHGARLPDARVNRYGKFLSGFWCNIFMNHYQGSAMAIRASLLGHVLPFPRHKLFLHDVWIGTCNDAAGGKTSFINEPLLYYRRHPKNSSLVHRRFRKIQVRLELLWAHLSRAASF
jgi:glycosyltransferase involved in cell wall biosynthesis